MTSTLSAITLLLILIPFPVEPPEPAAPARPDVVAHASTGDHPCFLHRLHWNAALDGPEPRCR